MPVSLHKSGGNNFLRSQRIPAAPSHPGPVPPVPYSYTRLTDTDTMCSGSTFNKLITLKNTLEKTLQWTT